MITNRTDHSIHETVHGNFAWKWTLLIVYGIVITLSVLSNLLIIYAYISNKLNQSSFNFCLSNLSFANFVTVVGFIPFISIDMHKMPQSNIELFTIITCGCAVGPTFMFIGVFSAIHNLCIMSIKRLLAIKKPLKRYLHKRTLKKFAIIDWCVCFLLHLPSTLLWTNQNGTCYRDWKWGRYFKVLYIIIFYIFGLFLPVFIMAVTYAVTVIEFFWKKKHTRMIGPATLKYRKRIVVLLGILILVFMTTNLPYCIYWLLSIVGYSPVLSNEIVSQKWRWYAFFPAVLKTLLDPLLYGYSSKNFRRVFSTIRGKHSAVITSNR